MCEFCHKHGEGRKWYLEAKNYAEDLMSDVRRRKLVAEFFAKPELVGKAARKLERLDRAPGLVKRFVRWGAGRWSKKYHRGQVVPIEDVERILDLTNSVIRIACLCRYGTRRVEGRYCYGVSMAPDAGGFEKLTMELGGSFLSGPDSGGVETMTGDEALAHMREHEHEGLCHTIWTFLSPFIGGICNCDRADCMAMRATVTHGVPVMFRAEYVAVTDPDRCTGCRQCMRVCQFGAIAYSAMRGKAEVDPRRCYGCGICRTLCAKDAMALVDRRSVEAARHLW